MADIQTYYEVVAVHDRGRVVIASDLTDEQSDRTRRAYINKHGLNVYVNGRKTHAVINIYRQKHAHKELQEDYTEVKKA